MATLNSYISVFVYRYCGAYCQQKDWPVHKQFCRERRLPTDDDNPPDR